MQFNNIFNLEVLKFWAKLLPSWFHDYFLQAVQTHNHSTRFTTDENWAFMYYNKETHKDQFDM